MSHGIFTDKNYQPTIAETLEVIATSRPVFEQLVNFIENNLRVHGEFKFYGKNYGWALRFNKYGKSLIALYPGENEFTVQIILNDHQVLDALNSNINDTIKNMISSTPEIHEGKWIFIKVDSDKPVPDLEKLILIRVKIL